MINSSGAQGFLGQTRGQNMELGRRRVGRNQLGGLWTTEVARKPPPRWCDGGLSAAAGGNPALQLSLGECGTHTRDGKNIMKMEHQR